VEARAGVVFINRVADTESQWHGPVGFDNGRGLMWSHMLGGTVWHHGGIDGRPGEGFRFGLTLWRWLVDRGGGERWGLRTRRFL
jgi:hypothetical protein